MGFDAIWISPIVKNIEGNTTSGQAFHGYAAPTLFRPCARSRISRSYWSQDITTLNPHFGSTDDFKALVDALHKRSMYLMVDIVVNHVAAPALPPAFDFSGFFNPFADEADFHKQCFVGTSADQNVVEQCWLGDENLPLPDINTEDPKIVDILCKWVHDIVQDYGIDGLRIDTVKHVRKDFWPGFASAAGVFTMGEVITKDPTFAAPYAGATSFFFLDCTPLF